MAKVLFARIGYMKHYQGPKPGDEKPIGGGKYNKTEIGHEAFNFYNQEGKLFGYFQPHMKEPYEINLKRINPKAGNNKVSGVTVIFFSSHPTTKGQVIVGWYKNATVHKSMLKPQEKSNRLGFSYNLEANAKDCVLLPISNRRFFIGHSLEDSKRGNPGQANAFYLFEDNGIAKDLTNKENSWISRALDYVENYNGPQIVEATDELIDDLETFQHSSGGQGFQSDVETRLKIEEYAMNTCRDYFESKGYAVTDTSANNPFDFIVSKGKKTKYVEVKGTQTKADSIILTKNEVEMSQNHGNEMLLFIVHSIVMGKKSVKKNSGSIKIIDPWKLDEDNLMPLSYSYKF